MNRLRAGNKQNITIMVLFAGAVGTSLIAMATIAAVSDSETMSHYRACKKVVARAGDLRRTEAEASENNSEQWRRDAVLVAAVEAPYLRPPVVWGEAPLWKQSTNKTLSVLNITTPTWNAEYKVLKQDSLESTVMLSVKGYPKYTFTLKKPFGNWWYISDIGDMSRNGAGPEDLKGIQLVELRPTIAKHGLKLVWNSKTKVAEVNGPNIHATLQAGYNQTKINKSEYICSACPMLIKGRLFVPEDLLSRIIAESLVKNL